MAQPVCLGALMQCSFGTGPSSLVVIDPTVICESKLAANIMDNVPTTNIPPFIMCTSMANPTVSAATAAASGVLTPMPCVPVTPSPWAPGSSTVMLRGQPALNNTSKLACNWGGVIQITNPQTTKETIP